VSLQVTHYHYIITDNSLRHNNCVITGFTVTHTDVYLGSTVNVPTFVYQMSTAA